MKQSISYNLYQAWQKNLIKFSGLIFFCWSLGQASPILTASDVGQAATFKMFETIKKQPDIDAYDTGG